MRSARRRARRRPPDLAQYPLDVGSRSFKKSGPGALLVVRRRPSNPSLS
jgi:hypothetical protein